MPHGIIKTPELTGGQKLGYESHSEIIEISCYSQEGLKNNYSQLSPIHTSPFPIYVNKVA